MKKLCYLKVQGGAIASSSLPKKHQCKWVGDPWLTLRSRLKFLWHETVSSTKLFVMFLYIFILVSQWSEEAIVYIYVFYFFVFLEHYTSDFFVSKQYELIFFFFFGNCKKITRTINHQMSLNPFRIVFRMQRLIASQSDLKQPCTSHPPRWPLPW